MTNKQESKYSMKLGLRDFLTQNATITAAIPNFTTLFTSFIGNINQIQVIREQQEVDKTGIAVNKVQLRADLIAKTMDVSRKTEAYAKMTNNAVLTKEVHYAESELKKTADTILKDVALLIHNKANANLAALATYGVTAAALTALKTAIDLFNASIPKPRLGITEKKQATGQLDKLFKANDEILGKFDTLVEIVRLSQPVFYTAYWDNRKVIETGTGSLKLNALISDAATGKGIKGAKVSFVPQNSMTKAASIKGEKPLVKTTTEKGGFNIKSLAAGIYTATVSKPGYKDQVVTVTVDDGDLTELIVKLEKVKSPSTIKCPAPWSIMLSFVTFFLPLSLPLI